MHVWRNIDASPVAEALRWPMLRRVTAQSHPIVRELLLAAQVDPPPIVDNLSLVDTPRWSKDNVVLLGDAAHCVTLVSGQGAGVAMLSAEILAQELGHAPIVPALAAHEQRLRDTIVRLQRRSRDVASKLIPDGVFALCLRNMAMRHLPRRWIENYLRHSLTLESQLVESGGTVAYGSSKMASRSANRHREH
jgi:2-polyprenyl-6-methoxyphenol hydroxylase-like FAD-dependent oxidoreductase